MMNKKIMVYFILGLVTFNGFANGLPTLGETIDQECPEGSSYTASLPSGEYGVSRAQSFVPSMSPLIKVELWMHKFIDNNPGDFVLSIRSNLGGSDLTSVTVDESDISGWPYHWEEFDFPDITVTTGQTYYIVFTAPDISSGTQYNLQGHGSGATYPQGTAWVYQEDVLPWTTEAADFSFRTYSLINTAPNSPSNPDPYDGETGVDINHDLSWSCSDPDGDTLTYDVYFEAGDSTPDVLVSNDQSSTTYDPGTMSYSTHYYW